MFHTERPSVALLLALLALLPSAVGQEHPTSLAPLIPDGALFVMRLNAVAPAIKNLRDTPLWNAFTTGPFREHLEREGVLAKLRSHAQKFESFTGMKPARFLRKLMGEELLVALFPGSGEPSVLLLAQGKPGTDAKAVLDSLLVPLQQQGDLSVLPPVTYNETEIRHFRNKKGEEYYLVTHGSALALAGDLQVLEHAVDLAKQTKTDTIVANPTAQEVCGNLVEDAHVAWYLNVPAIVSAFGASVESAPPPARPIVRVVKSLKGIASATWLGGAEIGSRSRISFDQKALPELLQSWLEKPERPSSLARYIPQGAAIAGMVGRVDFAGIAEAVLGSLSAEQRKQAEERLAAVDNMFLGGRSLRKELLPALGPELALVGTDIDRSDAFPGEISLIVELSNENGFQILGNLVRTLYGFTQMGPPQEAQKHTFVSEKDKCILTRKEAQVSPTVYLVPTALILSSSRSAAETIAGWVRQPPEQSVAEVLPPFKGFAGGVDCEALSQWLRRNRTALAEAQAQKQGISVEKAQQAIDALTELSSRFSALLVSGHAAAGGFEIASYLSVAP